MIKSCDTCGGLYATAHLESFAGTPCRCGTSHEMSLGIQDVEKHSQAFDPKSESVAADASAGLLPCPFCGGEAYWSRAVNGTMMAYVGCSPCGVSMKAKTHGYGDDVFPLSRDIISAWNTRAGSEVVGQVSDVQRVVDWLAHRCQYAPPCGKCIYCTIRLTIPWFDSGQSTQSSPEYVRGVEAAIKVALQWDTPISFRDGRTLVDEIRRLIPEQPSPSSVAEGATVEEKHLTNAAEVEK